MGGASGGKTNIIVDYTGNVLLFVNYQAKTIPTSQKNMEVFALMSVYKWNHSKSDI